MVTYMKTALGFLIVCAFIGMAVFGAFAMSQPMGEVNCLARTATGGNACQGIAGTAGVAAFHLNLLKSFSAAYVTAWAGLLLLLVMAFGVVLPELVAPPPVVRFAAVQGMHPFRERSPRFFSWLMLRARRDPSLS